MCFIFPSVPCSSSQANLQAPINLSFTEAASDFSADCGVETPLSVSTTTVVNIQPRIVLMPHPPRQRPRFPSCTLVSFVVDDFFGPSIQLETLAQDANIFIAASRHIHNHNFRFLHLRCPLDDLGHSVCGF